MIEEVRVCHAWFSTQGMLYVQWECMCGWNVSRWWHSAVAPRHTSSHVNVTRTDSKRGSGLLIGCLMQNQHYTDKDTMIIVDHSFTSSEDASFTKFWLSSLWVPFQLDRNHQIHPLEEGVWSTAHVKNSVLCLQVHISAKTRSPNPQNLHGAPLLFNSQ